MRKIITTILILIMVVSVSSCQRDAQIASHNLSKAADMFEIDRRVVFYNGITWEYILTIEGKCSIDWSYSIKGSFEVTCKVWDNEYKKHFLWLSDNVTYFAEQMTSKWVSVYHNRIIFKPQSIIPDIDFRWSTKDIPQTD